MNESRQPLPDPRTDGSVSVEAAIARRRSVRHFDRVELTVEEIGQLLWSAQGVTGDRATKRAAPSAGACHPIVVYVCRSDGVWRYHPEGHELSQHMGDDVREEVAQAAWGQSFIGQAPAVFVFGAVFERTTDRYQKRGRVRYVPMDAGHAAENLLLQAEALGLGGVPVGAFDDAAVRERLALPADEDALYLIPVGHPRQQ